jgi:hypothetical protein
MGPLVPAGSKKKELKELGQVNSPHSYNCQYRTEGTPEPGARLTALSASRDCDSD